MQGQGTTVDIKDASAARTRGALRPDGGPLGQQAERRVREQCDAGDKPALAAARPRNAGEELEEQDVEGENPEERPASLRASADMSFGITHVKHFNAIVLRVCSLVGGHPPALASTQILQQTPSHTAASTRS